MARLFTWLLVLGFAAAPAAAQSVIHVGAATAMDECQRGNIDLDGCRGLSGGFFVPSTLSERLTVAPEVRLTRGLWEGHISSYMIAGARVMWGF